MELNKTSSQEAQIRLLVRGLARAREHWGVFPSLLQQKYPKDLILALDIAGNGTERGRPSFTRISDYVEDLRARPEVKNLFHSDALRRPAKINLICISMGAMIGAAWAELYPSELASLTMINTSDGATSHFYERLRPRNYLSLLKMAVPFQSAQRKEQTILSMTALALRASKDMATQFASIPATSLANSIRQLKAAASYRFPKTCPALPVKILVGANDHLVDPVCSFRLAERWGLVPRIHPSGDHDLPLTDPQWVVDQV